MVGLPPEDDEMTPTKMMLRWQEVESMPPMGHGVEFFYGEQHNNDFPVAFIEGYGWMWHPEGEVPVYILTPTAVALPGSSKPASDVVAEVREGILYFLSHPQTQKIGRVRGNVWALFNA